MGFAYLHACDSNQYSILAVTASEVYYVFGNHFLTQPLMGALLLDSTHICLALGAVLHICLSIRIRRWEKDGKAVEIKEMDL